MCLSIQARKRSETHRCWQMLQQLHVTSQCDRTSWEHPKQHHGPVLAKKHLTGNSSSILLLSPWLTESKAELVPAASHFQLPGEVLPHNLFSPHPSFPCLSSNKENSCCPTGITCLTATTKLRNTLLYGTSPGPSSHTTAGIHSQADSSSQPLAASSLSHCCCALCLATLPATSNAPPGSVPT